MSQLHFITEGEILGNLSGGAWVLGKQGQPYFHVCIHLHTDELQPGSKLMQGASLVLEPLLSPITLKSLTQCYGRFASAGSSSSYDMVQPFSPSLIKVEVVVV